MSATALTLTNAPVVRTGMLVRKPAGEVFEALADPAHTSKFWFTKSTGELSPGAEVQWSWEMYGATVPARVTGFEPARKIVFEWGAPPAATTVELTFDARADGSTFVSLTETGFSGESGDDVVAWAIDSMAGFAQMLAALKAYLEHDIVLRVVADRYPDGLPA